MSKWSGNDLKNISLDRNDELSFLNTFIYYIVEKIIRREYVLSPLSKYSTHTHTHRHILFHIDIIFSLYPDV